MIMKKKSFLKTTVFGIMVLAVVVAYMLFASMAGSDSSTSIGKAANGATPEFNPYAHVKSMSSSLKSDIGFNELPPYQQQKLLRRVSSLAVVRDGGTVDDYLDLMKSWGGRFPLLPDETDNPEWIAQGEQLLDGWMRPDHSHAISQRYPEQAAIRIASRGKPGEANIRPSSKLMASSARITSIEFDDDVRALAREGTLAVEVKMPVVYNNGMEREEGFLMLWSEKEQQWLPYMRFTRAEKESTGEAVEFYMSFF